MCFYSKLSKTAIELENRFNAKIDKIELFTPTNQFNGFTFPKTPVISNANSRLINLFQWGLIPNWVKDDSIKQYTLNAKIETLNEKPAFKNSVNNRCLVIADGFYEWKWLDEKGKQKQKYLITLPDCNLFAFAGIWSNWVNIKTGEIINTYSIITTEANELMAEIHNSKKRMPVILSKTNEWKWLDGDEINKFKKVSVDLLAKEIS